MGPEKEERTWTPRRKGILSLLGTFCFQNTLWYLTQEERAFSVDFRERHLLAVLKLALSIPQAFAKHIREQEKFV